MTVEEIVTNIDSRICDRELRRRQTLDHSHAAVIGELVLLRAWVLARDNGEISPAAETIQ